MPARTKGRRSWTVSRMARRRKSSSRRTKRRSSKRKRAKHAKAPDADGGAAGGVDAKAHEDQLAQRDTRIAELEAQVADATKNAEAADELRSEWPR